MPPCCKGGEKSSGGIVRGMWQEGGKSAPSRDIQNREEESDTQSRHAQASVSPTGAVTGPRI